MTFTNKRSLIALLVSLVLVLSFFTVGVFADETTEPVSEEASATEEVSATETESAAETESATETATATESSTTETVTTEATTTTASTTTTTGDHNHDEFNWTELIVNLVIGGIIIIVGAILIIKNRVKLAAFLRSVKSETKKVVWSPKDQTRKNFLVVVVICIAVVILVGILDFAFGYGIAGLAKLFK